ncbi:MAG TPA: hopanoid-associated sugar epimerase [Terracidiphilus sp.]|jgi:dihydroflavonol-4-reductase|nr:hopanoid-associated sugar epimerase [Terracidiphilus sp.]
MKVFLTGATGFVGHHVAKALAAEGADLRMLVRNSSNLKNLEGIPGETVVGDLARPESFAPALTGCDAVMHVAADYRLWIRDPDTMYRANVDGTRDLLRLAREAKVPRVVYTSSVATMHFRTDGIVVNEDTPVSLADMVGHYKRSKFLAEQQAIAAAQDGQQVIILNPTTPIGPNDAKPTPTGRIFVDFLNRKFPAYIDTGLNLVDVAEVARTHVVALTKGKLGRRYILGGENLTLKQILDKMSAITGIPSPTTKIPFAVAATYAFFEEWITGRIRGKEPRATLEEVRMGRKKMFASSARAQQELGFRIVPVYPAMRAAIDWFRANGYAPQGPA